MLVGHRIAVLVTLYAGKILEPLWGSREFFRFVIIVDVAVGVATFVSGIVLYVLTRDMPFLFSGTHGYAGLIGAYLVAAKQLLPGQQTTLFFVLNVKTKDLPSMYVLVYLSFFLLFHSQVLSDLRAAASSQRLLSTHGYGP
jgi:hypothetical protein